LAWTKDEMLISPPSKPPASAPPPGSSAEDRQLSGAVTARHWIGKPPKFTLLSKIAWVRGR
jgi:hypothetical protein